MSELALDDVQRHTLTQERERVRVRQLVRRTVGARPASGALGSVARAADARHGQPHKRPPMTQNSGPTGIRSRARSHGSSCSKPQSAMPTSPHDRDDLFWTRRVRWVSAPLGAYRCGA